MSQILTVILFAGINRILQRQVEALPNFAQVFSSERILIHSKYDAAKFDYDVALVGCFCNLLQGRYSFFICAQSHMLRVCLPHQCRSPVYIPHQHKAWYVAHF